MQRATLFIGGLITGIVLMYAWGYITEPDGSQYALDDITTHTETGSSTPDTTEGDASLPTSAAEGISISTQLAGGTVTVQSVDLLADGWIVVHEMRDGVVANALGAIRRDAGSYTDIAVPLLRATMPGATYLVVLYADNGDRVFDLQTDTPLTGASGAPLMVSFTTQ